MNDPAFLQSVLQNLPDVDPDSEAVRAAMGAMTQDRVKAKVMQAAAAKVEKAAKKVEGVKPKKDDYDAMAEDKQGVQQEVNSGDKTKETKLNFKLVTKKEANLLSDEDAGNFFVQ